MDRHVFSGLDWRKWFDRMFPQTLQIAMWLLYIDGAFAFLQFLDRSDVFGASRLIGFPNSLVALLAVLAFPFGGLLMANGRRIGWLVALFASLSPFILRALLVLRTQSSLGLSWIVTQDNLIGFAFEAALVALLWHPMTQSHVRRWFR
jgi:hypothetical protein